MLKIFSKQFQCFSFGGRTFASDKSKNKTAFFVTVLFLHLSLKGGLKCFATYFDSRIFCELTDFERSRIIGISLGTFLIALNVPQVPCILDVILDGDLY